MYDTRTALVLRIRCHHKRVKIAYEEDGDVAYKLGGCISIYSLVIQYNIQLISLFTTTSMRSL